MDWCICKINNFFCIHAQLIANECGPHPLNHSVLHLPHSLLAHIPLAEHPSEVRWFGTLYVYTVGGGCKINNLCCIHAQLIPNKFSPHPLNRSVLHLLQSLLAHIPLTEHPSEVRYYCGWDRAFTCNFGSATCHIVTSSPADLLIPFNTVSSTTSTHLTILAMSSTPTTNLGTLPDIVLL